MSETVEAIAETLGLKKEELIKNGVKAYLESELRRLNAEIIIIHNRYGVRSLEELDKKNKQRSVKRNRDPRRFHKTRLPR